MAKPPAQFAAELITASAAVMLAAASGLTVIAISVDGWKGPELLVVSTPDLAALPGAHYRTACPDGGEEWAAPFGQATVTWFTDCPRAAA